jgi:hypothetical protein
MVNGGGCGRGVKNEGINHILENISFFLYLVIPFNIDSATKHTCSE